MNSRSEMGVLCRIMLIQKIETATMWQSELLGLQILGHRYKVVEPRVGDIE